MAVLFLACHAKAMDYVEKRVSFEEFERELCLIHFCAANNRVDLIQHYLDLGIDVNINNNSPQVSPLMLATYYNAKNAAKLLIEHGADPFQQNIKGVSSYQVATREQNSELLDLFNAWRQKNSMESTESEHELEETLNRVIESFWANEMQCDQEYSSPEPSTNNSSIDSLEYQTLSNENLILVNTKENFIDYIAKHPHYQSLSKRKKKALLGIVKTKKQKKVIKPLKKKRKYRSIDYSEVSIPSSLRPKSGRVRRKPVIFGD